MYTIQFLGKDAKFESDKYLSRDRVNLFRCFKFSQMLRRVDEAIPIFLNIFRWPTHLRNGNSYFFCWNHLNRVPRTDLQVIGVGLFPGNMDANFTANAPFNVNFTPTLQVMKLVILLHFKNAVDRADFETTLAASAVVGINYCQFLRKFFSGALLCHMVCYRNLSWET